VSEPSFGICRGWRGVDETRQTRVRTVGFPGQDSNRAPHEHKSEELIKKTRLNRYETVNVLQHTNGCVVYIPHVTYITFLHMPGRISKYIWKKKPLVTQPNWPKGFGNTYQSNKKWSSNRSGSNKEEFAISGIEIVNSIGIIDWNHTRTP
jgi:hypothetical protein